MTSTLAALLLAHAVADFLLQTDAIVATKRRPGTLLLHTAIVLVTAQAALGRVDAWEPVALAAAHIVIDTLKAYALPDRLWSFLADQALHLVTIIAVATFAPTLYAGGLWADLAWLPGVMALAAGLIIAAPAGGHAVAKLVAPLEAATTQGLPNGGRLIGLLERGIIYLLIIVGQPAGIGFLIAAKSVLRFEATKEDQSAGEYVIIGTLASFGWAMVAGWATLALVGALPPVPGLPG